MNNDGSVARKVRKCSDAAALLHPRHTSECARNSLRQVLEHYEAPTRLGLPRLLQALDIPGATSRERHTDLYMRREATTWGW